MRFFVPLSNNADHSEQLYKTLCDRLAQTKEAPNERRIYVLKFEEGGKRRTIAVGDQFHRLSDGPVLAIVQGQSSSNYYVYTPRHGAFEGEPYPIRPEESIEAEEFSALR
jgi:hypothetical protein